MLRRTLAVTLLTLGAGAALPASAQDFTWSADRPDSWALPGIAGDRTLAGGEVLAWYRFQEFRTQGLLIGTEEVDTDFLLDFYPVVPLRRTTRAHEAGIAFSPFSRLTLVGQGRFLQHALDEMSREMDLFRTESSGIGDVEVHALVDVLESGPYRAHVGMGASIPIGSITERAAGNGGTFLLPYAMQTGSGTLDLLPAGAMLAMNQHGSVGIRAQGTIRLGENERGYRLGHGLEVAGWASSRLNDWFSVSMGAVMERWGRIKGADPELDLEFSPSEDPSFSGGTFWDLPAGVNLFIREGLLGGHRLSIEGRWPMSQDAEGAQLRRDFRFTARWQKSVNLF